MEKYGVWQGDERGDVPKEREKLADGERGRCPQCGGAAVWHGVDGHGVWQCSTCGTAPWEVPPCKKPR